MFHCIPLRDAPNWWHGLAGPRITIKLFDTDLDAKEIVRKNVSHMHWDADYWVEENYGGVVLSDRSLVWVGIPRHPLVTKSAIPADSLDVLHSLLPSHRWFWRSMADRRLYKQVVCHLISKGMKEYR